MIKFILKCKNKHEFESWFSSSIEYERLKKKKLIECIFCKSKKVDKSIMSPHVVSTKQKINNVFKKNNFEVLNIAGGNKIKLLDLVLLIEKYCKKKAKKIFLGMQVGDIEKTQADIRKLKK